MPPAPSAFKAPLLSILLALPGAVPSAQAGTVEWPLPDGARCAFDGAFYSYAHPDGQGIKLWIPPGDRPVRGVILFGNPGGGLGGDTRNKSRQRDFMEFAARHGFGVAGVTGFPGRETFEKLGQRVIEAFDAWGRHGRHPELSRVPFIFSGSSNAGIFAFAMMMLVPERTICITPNVGPMYGGKIGDAARKTPAWLHVGTTDPFFPGGVEDTETLFAEHGDRALWAWEAEIKGHQNGSSDHVDIAYWDALIPLRLPAGAVRAGQTAPALMDLSPADGWYADLRTWDHHMTKVFPAREGKPFPQEKGRYGWLPTEGVARLYQAAATRARQMTLSFVEDKSVAGGESTGTYLSAGGSYVARPGDTVTVRVKLADLQQPVNPIEFYDRAEKIGEIDGTKTLDFRFTVQDRPLYAIHARAMQQRRDPSMFERVSNPLLLVVRQPELSAAIDAQLDAVDWAKHHRATALDPKTLDRLAGGPAESADTIPCAPLDASQASTIRPDGKVANAWKLVRQQAAPVLIGAESRVSGESAGTALELSAAHGEDGLYLLFRPGDNEAGRIDFHLASVGLPHVLASKGSLEVFTTPVLNQRLRHALQISFPVRETAGAPSEVSVNRWDPWDTVNVKLAAHDQFGGTGMWVDRATDDGGRTALEVFLPWAMVGNPGLRSRPPAGTSLASVIGYDGPAAKYRWPFGKDPWICGPASGENAARVFGQIVLLPR